MVIKSLELSNFRNYSYLHIPFHPCINILYGDNAQGKTNILEAVYVAATTKSHRTARDGELIRLGEEQAHIRLVFDRDGVERRVDMHLRPSLSKGIAIDGQKIKKASELLGLCCVVFFSPEDLQIVSAGPSVRRNFADMELCQLDTSYIQALHQYNKILANRNSLLRNIKSSPALRDTLCVWDGQLAQAGRQIIRRRRLFVKELQVFLEEIHPSLTGGRESLHMDYMPNVEEDALEQALESSQDRDIRWGSTGIGPHRDDFSFVIHGMDVRKFGSQGQKRTSALTLKLAQIELLRKISGHNPILLLDDVLSELDNNRKEKLLSYIGGMQTILTATGLDASGIGGMGGDAFWRVQAGSLDACGADICDLA